MNALKLNHSSQPQLLNDDSMSFSKVEHVLQSVNKLKKSLRLRQQILNVVAFPSESFTSWQDWVKEILTENTMGAYHLSDQSLRKENYTINHVFPARSVWSNMLGTAVRGFNKISKKD